MRPPLLTAADVAARLSLTASGVRSLARKGLIPSVRVAGRWRFEPDEIERYLAERRQVAVAPAQGTRAWVRVVPRRTAEKFYPVFEYAPWRQVTLPDGPEPERSAQ